jgi:pimeloyl-ACP methyl ester carboxylesterase
VQQPTLVIWGRLDRVLPVSQAVVAEGLPDRQIEIWENCGHHPFLEFADRFTQTVLKFLNP